MSNMTKQEILEAIDATIVPNDKKAITADSLANLLREMASATPESNGGGGGDTSLRLFLPDPLVASVFVDLELQYTREGWEAAKQEFEDWPASAVEAFDAYYNKMFDNNAEVYKQIQAAAAERKGISVVGDFSEGYATAMNILFGELQMMPLDYVNTICYKSLDCMYAEIGVMGQKETEFFLLANPSVFNEPFIGSAEEMTITLLPDGGLVMESTQTKYEVFVAENDAVLSEEQREKNKEYRSSSNTESVTFYYQPTSGTKPYQIYPISIDTESNKINYIIDTNVFQSTIGSDGNISTTLIGTLNIPQ